MRARLGRAVLWLAGLGCLCLPVCDDPPLRSEPFVVAVSATGVAIAWINAEPVHAGALLQSKAGNTVDVRRSGEAMRRHRFEFEGLYPDTEYAYSVRAAGEVRSGIVRTAPVDDAALVAFAIVGDSGDQPWWRPLQASPLVHLLARRQWLPVDTEVAAVAAAIARYAPDFLLHVGDVVYPGGEHSGYASGFYRPFADVLRAAPAIVALGNHDTADGDGVQWHQNLGHAGEASRPGRNTSFAYGNTRVLAIDLTTSVAHPEVGPQHPALRFLAAELRTATEPWLVVAGHYPIRSASRSGDREDLARHLAPLLFAHGVDLYVAGHDHCYQRFAFAHGDDVMPLVVTGGGGKRLYPVHPQADAAVLHSRYHWCAVEATPARLELRAHDLDGAVLDRLMLRSAEGRRLARIREVNPARARRIEASRR